MSSSSTMIIIVLIAGAGGLCLSSSIGMGVAYWQNWLCDSLGSDFGNSCYVPPSTPPPGDTTPPSPPSTPTDDKKNDDKKKDDKKKDDKKDTNDNKSRLIKAYGWMLDNKGNAKSGSQSWATLYHKTCQHPVWRHDGYLTDMNIFKLASKDTCGGNGWRLSGGYNNYTIYVHRDGSGKPQALKGKYGFYDVSSNGEFRLKNKTENKWLTLDSCTAGKRLSTVSNKSRASKFKWNNGCI